MCQKAYHCHLFWQQLIDCCPIVCYCVSSKTTMNYNYNDWLHMKRLCIEGNFYAEIPSMEITIS